MSQFQNFTSLTPQDEATFVVYEQRAAEASKSGMTFGLIAGIAVGLIILIIAFTVTPKHDSKTDGPTKATQKAPAE